MVKSRVRSYDKSTNYTELSFHYKDQYAAEMGRQKHQSILSYDYSSAEQLCEKAPFIQTALSELGGG